MSNEESQPTEPQPYSRSDWQFWLLAPLLAIVAVAGAAYQIGVNLKARMS